VFERKGESVTATQADDSIEVGAPTPVGLTMRPAVASSRFNLPRLVLVGLDIAALTLAWTAALLSPFEWEFTRRSWLVVGLGAGLTALLLVLFDLYKSRVSSVRSAELAAITRVVALVIPSILFFDLVATEELHLGVGLVAGLGTFLFLIIGRSVFDGWIRSARSQGRFTRSVVIVGSGPGAQDLIDMLADHEEAGYRVKGVVARREIGTHRDDWLGEPLDVLSAMSTVGANGAFVVVDELGPADRSYVLEQLTSAGHHVHLTMGIAGIASQRVQLAPVVHEPLLYVDAPTLKRWQLTIKRILDTALASVALLIALPFIALAALLIKLEDRGPVFFRQHRVGRGGDTFRLWKLRTMAVDAEARLAEVQADNTRGGPLLKVDSDPRITRVGRFLRFSSIDELPQLLNVLRGQMSLVGPRPALPTEVEAFDEELRSRHNVLPGITGLWQVEARDNPSFASYRRLDLFYVKNWSISLDLVILILTVQTVLVRAAKGVISRGEGADLC
jgi:exopolysaccharide biosynthesis polyprenyl glycosylphosphotransferase